MAVSALLSLLLSRHVATLSCRGRAAIGAAGEHAALDGQHAGGHNTLTVPSTAFGVSGTSSPPFEVPSSLGFDWRKLVSNAGEGAN